jgi:hypothetical protein
MAQWCHAQKHFKNEFSVGYFATGYFFDATPLTVSKFNRGKSISLNYKRNLPQNFTLSLTYHRCFFQYVPAVVVPPDSTIIQRYLRMLSANLGYGYTKWGLTAQVKTGLRYNIRGYQGKHIRSRVHSKGWGESYGEIYGYRKIVGILGASIVHPIFWRFFGELDCEYAHFFSGVDRRQLLLSYRVGIRF